MRGLSGLLSKSLLKKKEWKRKGKERGKEKNEGRKFPTLLNFVDF